MKYPLKTEDFTIFVGSAPIAKSADAWVDGNNKGQKVDETSGLPIWTLKNVELIAADGEVVVVNIKVLAKDAPVLSARTEYRIKGNLLLTAYANDAGRSAVSFTLNGELVPKNSALGGLPPIK